MAFKIGWTGWHPDNQCGDFVFFDKGIDKGEILTFGGAVVYGEGGCNEADAVTSGKTNDLCPVIYASNLPGKFSILASSNMDANADGQNGQAVQKAGPSADFDGFVRVKCILAI